MKKLVLLALLALELAVCGCGNSTNASNVPTTASSSSNWEAILSGGAAQAGVLNFVTTFSVGTGGGTLDITYFSFLTSGPCFGTQTENGSAVFTTSSTNQVTGTLTYTVTGTSTSSVLTLNGDTVKGTSNNGTLQSGAVSGTWTLTGPTGCSGSGSFILCQGTSTCSTTT